MPHVPTTPDTPDEMPLAPIGEPVTVTLDNAEDGESKSSSKPMITLTFKIVADGEDYDGARLWEYLVEPQASKRTQIQAKKIATAFGADASSGVDFDDLLGKECKVVLKKDQNRDGVEGRRIKAYVAA